MKLIKMSANRAQAVLLALVPVRKRFFRGRAAALARLSAGTLNTRLVSALRVLPDNLRLAATSTRTASAVPQALSAMNPLLTL
jgi:hypothetical protein